MKIAILAAMSENRVIGRGGELPWRLPADLRYVKRLTDDHVLVMGRRTFESVGRPLPGRTTIIVTRNREYRRDDAVVAASLDDALAAAALDDRARRHEEVFIMGGAEIYRLALPIADRLYLTRVHAELEGDTFFPDFDPDQWRLVSSEHHAADESHAYPLTFDVYEHD